MAKAFGRRVRPRSRPKDPEALALGVLALRSFAEDASGSAFERDAASQLKRLGINRKVASRMVARFDAIRPSVKNELLGEFVDLAKDPPTERLVRDPVRLKPVRGMTRPVVVAIELARTVDARVTAGPASDVGLDDPEHPFVPEHTIRYKGLQCLAETTFDRFSNSDEVYFVTSALEIDEATGANELRTERHPTREGGDKWYEDVDAGDSRSGPVAACWRGATDVVSLTVVAFERDDGDPDAYKEEVATAVAAAAALGVYLYPALAPLLLAEAVREFVTDFVNSLLGSGDDQIETVTEVITREDLEQFTATRALDHRGDGILYHFVSSHRGSGAQYLAAFDVQRKPPQKIPEPIVE